MSNSNLVNYTKISPNSTNPRKDSIKKITIHHMAGNLTIEGCGDLFANPSRQASANYGIGTDGRVGMYVEECNRAWTSGDADNDSQAVTIEVANDGGAPDWHVSDTALAKLIDLCVDICKRNNIPSLNFTGNANGNLTMHCYFQATACPGPYLKSKFTYIADEVNKRLKESDTSSNGTIYKVQVGAYKIKANAEGMLAKLKAAQVDGFIVQVNGMYKVQVGAYNLKSNAEAKQDTLKLIGFDAFITTEQGEATTSTTVAPKPDIIYAIKTAANGWLPEVKNTEDYAGIENRVAIGVMIKLSDGTPLKYRVHTTAGKWLGWITGYDKNDYYSGYAGDDKTPIDAIEIKCDKHTVKYKVSSVKSGAEYYPTVSDTTVSGSESYAGVFGKPIDKFMAWLE